MNPFNITFGIKTDNYIQRYKNYNEIIDYFNETSQCGRAFIISGIREYGKIALTLPRFVESIEKYSLDY